MVRLPDRLRRAKDRAMLFWRTYNASLLLVLLMVVVWRLDGAIERLERTEAEGRATAAALATEREERIIAFVQQQTALAKVEAETAQRLARVTRQANLDGCARDNQMRRRWRTWASAQLEVSRSTSADATPNLSLREFFALRDREEAALQQLYGELAPVDCNQAYPPVVPAEESP